MFFLLLTKPNSCNKIISKWYNAIWVSKQESTEYIKKKWEKERKVLIMLESWENKCQLQWLSTGSNTWWEFCWKNIVRFFVTPIQKRDKDSRDACWRLCGTKGADHFHVFWDCQVIRTYSQEICKHIKNVFDVNIPHSNVKHIFGWCTVWNME